MQFLNHNGHVEVGGNDGCFALKNYIRSVHTEKRVPERIPVHHREDPKWITSERENISRQDGTSYFHRQSSSAIYQQPQRGSSIIECIVECYRVGTCVGIGLAKLQNTLQKCLPVTVQSDNCTGTGLQLKVYYAKVSPVKILPAGYTHQNLGANETDPSKIKNYLSTFPPLSTTESDFNKTSNRNNIWHRQSASGEKVTSKKQPKVLKQQQTTELRAPESKKCNCGQLDQGSKSEIKYTGEYLFRVVTSEANNSDTLELFNYKDGFKFHVSLSGAVAFFVPLPSQCKVVWFEIGSVDMKEKCLGGGESYIVASIEHSPYSMFYDAGLDVFICYTVEGIYVVRRNSRSKSMKLSYVSVKRHKKTCSVVESERKYAQWCEDAGKALTFYRRPYGKQSDKAQKVRALFPSFIIYQEVKMNLVYKLRKEITFLNYKFNLPGLCSGSIGTVRIWDDHIFFTCILKSGEHFVHGSLQAQKLSKEQNEPKLNIDMNFHSRKGAMVSPLQAGYSQRGRRIKPSSTELLWQKLKHELQRMESTRTSDMKQTTRSTLKKDDNNNCECGQLDHGSKSDIKYTGEYLFRVVTSETNNSDTLELFNYKDGFKFHVSLSGAVACFVPLPSQCKVVWFEIGSVDMKEKCLGGGESYIVASIEHSPYSMFYDAGLDVFICYTVEGIYVVRRNSRSKSMKLSYVSVKRHKKTCSVVESERKYAQWCEDTGKTLTFYRRPYGKQSDKAQKVRALFPSFIIYQEVKMNLVYKLRKEITFLNYKFNLPGLCSGSIGTVRIWDDHIFFTCILKGGEHFVHGSLQAQKLSKKKNEPKLHIDMNFHSRKGATVSPLQAG